MHLCHICLVPTSLYNYGVPSCNACKMFFRRVLRNKSELEKCGNNGKCFEALPFDKKCRQCRYEKCLSMGMRQPSSHHFNLSDILSNLLYRNENWMSIYTTHCPPSINPSIDDILHRHVALEFTKKPLNYQMRPEQWSFHCEIACVNFLKNLEIMNELEVKDQKILLKCGMFKCCMLRHSMNAAIYRTNFLTFPDGSKMAPECLSKAFDSKFRNRLVARLIELKIDENEAVLLGMVMFCDPAHQKLTDHGREIVSKYQAMYSSSLMQYCQIKHQKGAPTRFTDIVSLFHIVTQMFTDMCTFCEIIRVYQKHSFNQITLDCI